MKHRREKKKLKHEVESLKQQLNQERCMAAYQAQHAENECDTNYLAVAIADLRQKVIEIKADTEEKSQANVKALQATVDAICKNVSGMPYIRVQDKETEEIGTGLHFL